MHLAIILDGNRRFAKKLVLQPWKGHEYGKEKVRKMLDWAKELDIDQLTFYALSVENIKKRPKQELDYLLGLMRSAFRELEQDIQKLNEDSTKVRFIGELKMLPQDLQEQCRILEEKTQNNNRRIINFAIAYGGRQEIVEAVRKIVKQNLTADGVTEDEIKQSLYLEEEPDLIIRTGGEKRTSNFLLWQSAYSEWFFLDKMWPEFEKQDLISCMEEFRQRKRNFGA